eukprot:TRINITY_DN4118_c1_g1_i3.p1 TRINITY_DN4118_c1_g1~~TRINITY_DN4118_c1_g1_i3.p1  ORF type:complete len:450 (-),score=80.24 TRINITY_DN4118_c1_g1_i3:129-1478(-)
MAHIGLDLDDIVGDGCDTRTHEVDASLPCYWKPENHSSDNYLRVEQWMVDLEEFTFPTKRSVVEIKYDAAQAMLRYVEEMKMYSNIEEQKRAAERKGEEKGDDTADPFHDPSFLDMRHDAVWKEWPEGKERSKWFVALSELEASLDKAVRQFKGGAFVKLSVRSPKDSVFDMATFKGLVEEKLDMDGVKALDHPEALSQSVAALKYACWKGMQVHTGREALVLLLRSERIYLDILQHDLFIPGGEEAKRKGFDMDVHVSEFFEGFDPIWEFRGFVADGVRTSLTAYNPWVYDRSICEHKDAILRLISDLWDRAGPKIRSENYTLDFAVSKDLKKCYIVELNNFLPPLSGSCLFDYKNAHDRALLASGPFEFRVRDVATTVADFVSVSTDAKTGKTRTMVMQPAPPHLMLFVENAKRKRLGKMVPGSIPGLTRKQLHHFDSLFFYFIAFL